MIPALIAAGASLVGGLLSKKSSEKQSAASTAAQIAAQREAIAAQERQAAQNLAYQREFAQNGIAWRVADAKASGISPLYALGASVPTYTPSAIVGSPGVSPPTFNDPMGPALANAGQHISRALDTTSTIDQKFQRAAQILTLQKGELENQLLASQLARQSQSPPMPTPNSAWLLPGQGDTAIPGVVVDQPLKRTVSSADAPHITGAAVPDVQQIRTEGGLYPAPTKDVAELIEDNLWHQTAHFFRNNIVPMFRSNPKNAGGYDAPPGYHWAFNPIYGYTLQKTRFYR